MMIWQEENMAQLVVRNIESSVKARLQRRARRNGRSMEAEARDILRSAVTEEPVRSRGLGTEISSLFAAAGLEVGIAELPGRLLQTAAFDEE